MTIALSKIVNRSNVFVKTHSESVVRASKYMMSPVGSLDARPGRETPSNLSLDSTATYTMRNSSLLFQGYLVSLQLLLASPT